jgi:tetratricopeptide (TPR) repeat protein
MRGIAESPDPADRGQGSVATSIPYYEKALALAPEDDAALHYLAHAYENMGEIDKALEYGKRYAEAAAAVPHAQHMRGHSLMRLGRIEEAVASFEAADRIDRAYLAAEHIPPEYEWHYEHNLDLLGESYAYLGETAKAERALKEAFGLPTALLVQALNKRNWPAFLIARGRLDEAREAAAALEAHQSAVIRAMGHIAAGHAELAAGRFKETADEANAALRELQSEPEAAPLAMAWLVNLQGQFLLRTGQHERGETMLREIVQRARAATGPDAFMDGLFTMEAIAKVARESGERPFAAWVADQMMAFAPDYPGSHLAAGP